MPKKFSPCERGPQLPLRGPHNPQYPLTIAVTITVTFPITGIVLWLHIVTWLVTPWVQEP